MVGIPAILLENIFFLGSVSPRFLIRQSKWEKIHVKCSKSREQKSRNLVTWEDKDGTSISRFNLPWKKASRFASQPFVSKAIWLEKREKMDSLSLEKMVSISLNFKWDLYAVLPEKVIFFLQPAHFKSGYNFKNTANFCSAYLGTLPQNTTLFFLTAKLQNPNCRKVESF